MIQYDNEKSFRLLLKMTGSAIPRSLPLGLGSCAIGIILACLRKFRQEEWQEEYVKTPFAIEVVAVLIGYLLVMRTNMALHRWMHAISEIEVMLSKWSDAFNSLNSFFSGRAKAEGTAQGDAMRIIHFRVRVAHWFSLMCCLAFAELRLEKLSDLSCLPIWCKYPSEIRSFSSKPPWMSEVYRSWSPAERARVERLRLQVLHAPTTQEVELLESCADKVNMIALWIMQAIMIEIKAGLLDAPAPIVTRVFQDLSMGLLGYHQAHKVAMVPFPFPFAHLVSLLIVVLLLVFPFYVDIFTKHTYLTPIMSFVVPMSYCSLNILAVDLEAPFDTGHNAIDLEEFNWRFLNLIEDTLVQREVPPPMDEDRELENEILREMNIVRDRGRRWGDDLDSGSAPSGSRGNRRPPELQDSQSPEDSRSVSEESNSSAGSQTPLTPQELPLVATIAPPCAATIAKPGLRLSPSMMAAQRARAAASATIGSHDSAGLRSSAASSGQEVARKAARAGRGGGGGGCSGSADEDPGGNGSSSASQSAPRVEYRGLQQQIEERRKELEAAIPPPCELAGASQEDLHMQRSAEEVTALCAKALIPRARPKATYVGARSACF